MKENDTRSWANAFYSSKTWQNCRNAYVKLRGGLCEECQRHGRFTIGTEVHHIKHLTRDNIRDPDVSLNFDNLELLCKDCHARKHRKDQTSARYTVDELGHVVIIDDV